MDVKPGYKQTEVGIIPEDWEVSTVGHEFEIKLGKMLDAERNVGVPKPYLGNKAVQWGRIDITDLPTVPMSRADIEKYRLCKDDLLVCEGGEVGRAAIWEAPISECYYQKALHRLRPLHGFNSQLMVALLRQWSDRGVLKNYVTQTSIAHLPREKFIEVPMPVPPVSEQRAIATALSDVDALLGGLERLIAKKRDIKQAAMQQLLTGQTRLPGFHGNWEVSVLGNVVDALEAGVSVNSTDDDPWPGTPCVLKTSALSSGVFLSHEAKRIVSQDRFRARTNPKRDTILISRMNTPNLVGEIAYVGRDYPWLFLPDRVWMTKFRETSNLNVRWLAYVLSSREYKELLKGIATGTSGSMKNIAKDALLNLPIRFPKSEEQTAIAAVLSDIDAELSALEARRDKTRALKQAMMQELLTGKTRLVTPSSNVVAPDTP